MQNENFQQCMCVGGRWVCGVATRGSTSSATRAGPKWPALPPDQRHRGLRGAARRLARRALLSSLFWQCLAGAARRTTLRARSAPIRRPRERRGGEKTDPLSVALWLQNRCARSVVRCAFLGMGKTGWGPKNPEKQRQQQISGTAIRKVY